MRKKVVHFTTTIDNGGAENHLRDLITYQTSRYDVSVVYFKGNPHYLEYYEGLNVNVYKSSWWKVLRNTRIIHSADIVHAHLIYSEIAIYLTRVFKNKIYLVSKHNDAYYPYIYKWMARLIFPQVNKRFSKVICITDNVRKYCGEYQNLNQSRLQVIYYGINTNIFTNISKEEVVDLREKILEKNDGILIGVVARLHRQKRLDILLRALHHFKDSNWKLVIAGEGNEKESLLKLSKNLTIDDKVKFLGKVNYVPQLMNSLDLFVLPSEHEGLGLVLLEAMSTSAHIIGSDAGAIPEVLGQHGRIFKTNSVESLSSLLGQYMEGIQTISSSEIELRRRRLKSVFDIEKNYNIICSLYGESF